MSLHQIWPLFAALVWIALPSMLHAQLSAERQLAAGKGADGIEIGDVNGDGVNELIVANRVSWDVHLYGAESRHRSSLRLRERIRTGWAPATIAVADVDGDSRNDLVIAHYDDYQGSGRANSFGVCYQDPSTGSLRAETKYYLPRGLSSRAIGVGDVNSDGKIEIIVANESRGNQIYVWGWDQQAGSLQLIAAAGPIRGYVVSIAIGDVNGDGQNDVVLYGTRLQVFLQAWGTLASPVDYGRTSGESGAIGDVNNDGLNDVVGGTAGSGRIEIWLQTADHRLRRGGAYDCGRYTEDVEVEDLNHDGLLDVAVAGRDTGTLFVFFQDNSGQLQRPVSYQSAPDRWFNELAVGDLNSDGINDLVGSHWGDARPQNPRPGVVSVWFGQEKSSQP